MPESGRDKSMAVDGNRGRPAVHYLVVVAALVIVVAGMRAAAPVLVLFLLSVFIAVVSAPPFFWLQRKRVPKLLAVMIVVAGVIGFGVLVAQLVGSSVEDFSRDLPFYQSRLQEESAVLIGWLRGLGVEINDRLFLDTFNPGAAMKLAAGMLKGLGGVLTNAFLILLTVIFILLEASSFPAKLRATLGDPDTSAGYFRTFLDNVQRYMAIKTLVSLATGAVIAVWLTVLGVDYPLLWGLLAFLLNYVPNIGSIIAAVPAVLLALIQLGAGTALLTALGYVALNVTMGNLVEPRVMGRGLGLSTLVVFLSLVFWGWVLGLVGMLLAVPLTMTLKIALDSNEETRWISVLLGPESQAAALSRPPRKEQAEEQPGSTSSES